MSVSLVFGGSRVPADAFESYHGLRSLRRVDNIALEPAIVSTSPIKNAFRSSAGVRSPIVSMRAGPHARMRTKVIIA